MVHCAAVGLLGEGLVQLLERGIVIPFNLLRDGALKMKVADHTHVGYFSFSAAEWNDETRPVSPKKSARD